MAGIELRVEAIRSTDQEEDAISAAAARLAREVSRAWLARPWGAGRVDRTTIDSFHKAAIDGDSELVARMLIEVGRFGTATLLESRNSAGWTPLMWASWHAKVPVMRRLIQARCNVNASDRYGQSALSLAAESTSRSQEAAVTLLLDARADTTQKGYEGRTPAEWAEETGNPRLAAHIRRAPTRRSRWMAAEQRLALAKLLHRRLGGRSCLYPLVNRDVMEVIARWMPYTRRRDVWGTTAHSGTNGTDKLSELDPLSAGSVGIRSAQLPAQRGLRRRRPHRTAQHHQQVQVGQPGGNDSAPPEESDDGAHISGTQNTTGPRIAERQSDVSDDDDCDSEVLDRYLECVDTLIERHGHQPVGCDSTDLRIEPRRDRARALHLDIDVGECNATRGSGGTEWRQLSIRCAHCALRSDVAARVGLTQSALQQHCKQQYGGHSCVDFVVMMSPAPVNALSTVQRTDHEFDHGGGVTRSLGKVESAGLPDSPRSPHRLPPRVEYGSVVACAPARSYLSSLFDAVSSYLPPS